VDEIAALAELKLKWTPVADDVWQPSDVHVEGLHREAAQTILDGLAEASDSESSPVGVVIQGQRGAGKTHLLGWVREKVCADGGYFVLVSLLDGKGFWQSVVVSMLDSLSREVNGRETQLQHALRSLASLVGVPRNVRRAVAGETTLTREALDTFVDALRRYDRRVGADCHDTARALALCAGDDFAAQDIGRSFLLSHEEDEPGERSAWGIRRTPPAAQEVVRDVSRLLALTGPCVIGVDQIDILIAQSALATSGDSAADWPQALLIEQVAGGLVALREVTRRTLTVVACIPATWALIRDTATDTFQDRFRDAVQLGGIPSAEIGQALVEKRFTARFTEIGFEPPYPTWPVRPEAFADAPNYTPRQLLRTIDAHIRACVRRGEVRELERLGAAAGAAGHAEPMAGVDGTGRTTGPEAATGEVLDALDARFAQLREAADVSAALDRETEDQAMPPLLTAGLWAWIAEQGEAGQAYAIDAPPSAKPPLHARLRRTLDEATEDEAHWCFRAIAASNAVAAQHRIRAAASAAGLTEGITKRRLFLLRNGPWPSGPRTRELVEAFTQAGGVTLPVSVDDLKTLAALRDLLAENPPGLPAWLAARRPAAQIDLLRAALRDAAADPAASAGKPAEAPPPGAEPPHETGPPHDTESPHGAATARAAAPDAASGTRAPGITIGVTIDTQEPVRVELEAFRKHVAIFAGSGSGKTVLIRRIVEECALHGVSAIVLDPNNDLARLGDPWPQPPERWGAGDPEKAARYLADTDVVVWTPLREAGRPLHFPSLPDFRQVVGDADEFNAAVNAAVASLAPRAKVDGATAKAHLGRAVLTEALRHFARRGGGDLRDFIGMLSQLPDGVSELARASRIAADMAEHLTASMVNDPLFAGAGEPVDPGTLLTPPPGKRARVSVISLIGLAADEQRQSFVNQLQMALFAWIKRHPAGDRPLGGLFVMDEAQTFAPSGAMTACTHSTLALASQARKYGLGLVFATQAPKGLHNHIPGNAATQFFGLLNSPIQIEAARQVARAKGGDVPDVSRLSAGQFYTALEGSPFVKVRTPLCLTYHPRSPLSPEEVVERARRR